MHEQDLILALARVVVAAGWADGRMENAEINALKDLLFRLPHLDEGNWKRLEMYIASPVEAGEAEVLLEAMLAEIRSPADKALAMSTLQALVEADGTVTEEEASLLTKVRDAIDSQDIGLLGGLKAMLGLGIKRRSEIGRTREAHFEDFVRNKVFYKLSQSEEGQAALAGLEEKEQRKLCLAGALMGRIAHVDEQIQDGEVEMMNRVLRKFWNLSEGAARLVAEVAVSASAADLDDYRTTRRFVELTTHEERESFAAVLFALSGADGDPSFEEMEAIRGIADGLRLTHQQFIRAKVAGLG